MSKGEFFATLGAMAKGNGQGQSLDGAITKFFFQMWLVIPRGHLM
jgi:hypothetical protein